MRIGLNHYLFKIKQVDSDRCSYEEGSQTPKHVLLDCPKFSALRLEMWRKIERVKGLPRDFDRYDYDQLVSEPRVVRLVANFVLATGLLQQFREVPKQADIEDDSGWRRWVNRSTHTNWSDSWPSRRQTATIYFYGETRSAADGRALEDYTQAPIGRTIQRPR